MALTSRQKSTVIDIVKTIVPQAEVFVFGSRATLRARPFSDLDLLFAKPERLSLEQRADLRDAFEASDLPFCVDIVESASLQPLVAKRVLEERMALI